jgi:hypothetical protein
MIARLLTTPRKGRKARPPSARLAVEALEGRAVPAATPRDLPGDLAADAIRAVGPEAGPLTLVPGEPITGTIAGANEPRTYALPVEVPGRLAVSVIGQAGFLPTLSLSRGDKFLMASASGPGSPADVSLHLAPGIYQLTVAAGGAGSDAGSFRLASQFVPANPDPLAPAGLLQPSLDSIETADVNSDGYPNLVGAGPTGTGLTLLLGVGDGTFRPAVLTPLAIQVGPLAVADFDGDGFQDVAVFGFDEDSSEDRLTVLLGNGDGTFRPTPSEQAPGFMTDLVVVYLPGDARPDLVGVVSDDGSGFGGEALAVFRNAGGGNFTADPPVLVGAEYTPTSLTTGDFNGDGAADLATANLLEPGELLTPGTVTVLLGDPGAADGEPAFRRVGPDLPVGTNPYSPQVGDFDGDGITDLAILMGNVDGATVLFGRGRGRFLPAWRFEFGGVESQGFSTSMVAADFNGDGRTDLAAVLGVRQTVSVLLAGPGRQFGRLRYFAGINGPSSGAVADFNRDGRADLAVTASDSTGEGSGTAAVLLGRGDGTFADGFTARAGQYPVAVVTADLNRDGLPDLITANRDSQDVSVLLSNGDGTFQSPVSYTVGQEPNDLAVADFNRDGRLDVAVTAHDLKNPFKHIMAVLLGLGDGRFLTRPAVQLENAPFVYRQDLVAAGDFDQDGRIDLAVSDARESDGAAFVRVYWGEGRGGFVRGRVRTPVGGGVSRLRAADFNRDGATDLAVYSAGDDEVAILYGGRRRRFEAGPWLSAVTGPRDESSLDRDVVVADLDRDPGARPDVAVVQDGRVAVYLNREDGFQLAGRYLIGSGANSILASDFNGDGLLDLGVAKWTPFVSQGPPPDFQTADGGELDPQSPPPEPAPPTAVVLLGAGAGVFGPPRSFGIGNSPTLVALAAADFNGDGSVDLVGADTDGNNLPVLLGAGAGTFAPAGDAFPDEFRPDPAVGRLDGDEAPDVVTVDRGGRLVVRFGIAGAAGTFGPAATLDGRPARAAAIVRTAAGPRLVALPMGGGPLMVYPVGGGPLMFYPVGGRGQPVNGPDAGPRPSALTAADLDGDGLDDLAVLDAGRKTLTAYAGTADGGFARTAVVTVGNGPAAVVPIDLDGRSGTDLVVIDELAGQVTVLVNDGRNGFAARGPYPAQTGAAGVVNGDGSPAVRSADRPVAAGAGRSARTVRRPSSSPRATPTDWPAWTCPGAG